ncbi:MAG: HEAT repeat domain-containing protein [Planctomycetes bacterium]|nr:HEAT repeat domain-containing protein [Planctomycetota bacterium]
MRRFALLAFFLAAPMFAAAGDAQPVEDLIAQLRSRYLREREAAVNALVECGPKIAPRLVDLLQDADGRVQRAAVEILSRIGTPETIQPLLPLLTHKDPSIRGQVRDAFLRLGRTVRPALEAARDADPNAAPDITELLEEMTQDDVESVFAGEVMGDGTTGFYAGQFEKLKSLGPDIGPMLAKMGASTERFEFRKDRTGIGRFRIMAIDAVADIGYKEAIPDLERVAEGNTDQSRAAAGALWRMGKKEPAEKLIASLKEAMDQQGAQPMRSTFEQGLAELYSRTDQHEEAVKMHQSAIAQGRATGTTYYNMACAYSRMGKKKEAIAALQRALKSPSPFHNVQWMKVDGDLQAIRGEPEFRQMVIELGGGEGAEAPEPTKPHSGGGGTD